MVDELEPGQFVLFDLEVVVEQINGHCTCSMKIGDKFRLEGGRISFPQNQEFCVYALQSTLPLLPAKQRQNHLSDWMETDARITCPDPACGLIMRVDRVGQRIFNHDDVSTNKSNV